MAKRVIHDGIKWVGDKTPEHTKFLKTLKYLPIGYTDVTIDYCIRHSRFQALSKGREAGQEDSSSHFRKGIIGDWKNYLDDSLHAQFLDIGGEVLKELGYEI
jgi:hypothetical protein